MKRLLLLSLSLLTLPAMARAQSTTPDGPQTIVVQSPTPLLTYPRYETEMPVQARPPRAHPRVRAYHGGAVPENWVIARRYNRALLLGGVVPLTLLSVINTFWALAACPPGASDTTCQSNTAWLYVPVLGPFLTAASGNATFGGRNLAILDGVMQTAAATMMIAALITSHRVLVEHLDEEASAQSHRRAPQWALAPTAGPNTFGAALSLTTF